MKDSDCTKLIAELESDSVQYRNYIILYFIACFGHVT